MKHFTTTTIPLFLSSVQAGFPSPADDFLDKKINLNDFLIDNPSATFLLKVKGSSMIGAGIAEGDYLIVDRSLYPKTGDIIVAYIDGEFTVKRYFVENRRIILRPENDLHRDIKVEEYNDFQVFGVVKNVIKMLGRGK